MKSLHVKGKVFSGKGEATKFTELPWVKRQITEKLGFTPRSGTLNIKLSEEYFNLKNVLKRMKGIEITPTTGFCRGKCFRASLMDGVECAIVIPEVADYPEGFMEIMASVNLREKFHLEDGDAIEVKILLG
ncbi:CTP-dependent riboflavin kinase [Candidatus Bathyarchaeota archaeon]|nr:CTP-dependent riboflavin kinase [Candidatus Bathyarchaeota archaeon]